MLQRNFAFTQRGVLPVQQGPSRKRNKPQQALTLPQAPRPSSSKLRTLLQAHLIQPIPVSSRNIDMKSVLVLLGK